MFKPFANRILAELVVEKESKGGIQLPDGMKKTSKEAIIIELGSSVSADLKVGNKIMFSRSMPVVIDEKPYIILTEDDVIGIFKEK